VGIGTVSGNLASAPAARNALDLIALAGQTDIPVAVGAHDHLSHGYGGGAPHVHGVNGIGDVELPRSTREPRPGHAVDLLLELSHTYAGELEILAIGPLTNLALALQSDPSLAERVRIVTIMGGAGIAAGNITAVAEANIGNDPEAAAAVLAADWDVTLVPLDVTMEHTLEEVDREALLTADAPFPRALGQILDHYFDFYEPTYGRRMCALHDPLAAALAVGDVTATRAPLVPITVDTSDGPGRGQTIADLRNQRLADRHHDGHRTRFVREIDRPLGPHVVALLTGMAAPSA
jgi:purine nucleosidase